MEMAEQRADYSPIWRTYPAKMGTNAQSPINTQQTPTQTQIRDSLS